MEWKVFCLAKTAPFVPLSCIRKCPNALRVTCSNINSKAQTTSNMMEGKYTFSRQQEQCSFLDFYHPFPSTFSLSLPPPPLHSPSQTHTHVPVNVQTCTLKWVTREKQTSSIQVAVAVHVPMTDAPKQHGRGIAHGTQKCSSKFLAKVFDVVERSRKDVHWIREPMWQTVTVYPKHQSRRNLIKKRFIIAPNSEQPIIFECVKVAAGTPERQFSAISDDHLLDALWLGQKSPAEITTLDKLRQFSQPCKTLYTCDKREKSKKKIKDRSLIRNTTVHMYSRKRFRKHHSAVQTHFVALISYGKTLVLVTKLKAWMWVYRPQINQWQNRYSIHEVIKCSYQFHSPLCKVLMTGLT